MTRWEQEPDVISSRYVLLVLVGVVVATAIGIAVAWQLSQETPAARLANRPAESNQIPPDVNAMETTPFTERAEGYEDREREAAWLDSYGWVDRKAGIVHIPIDRAIDLYLGRGQSGRAQGQP